MAATPSLLVAYTILDRGITKNVTNRFHFSGGTPADDASWATFADAVVADLAPALSSESEIIRADGYAAGSDVAVWSKAYTTPGALTPSTTAPAVPGFCCALLRWSTDQRTTKNHPIYLFSYVHGVIASGITGANIANLKSNCLTALQSFATKWWNAGYSDGTNTYHRAGPNGAVALSSTVDTFIRDHDLSPR